MQRIILKGTDISFKYGNNVVLDKCNFSIEEGDFAAVIGSNGSGKSTLLKISLGLLKQQSGTIQLYGKNINEFNEWKHIGYVPQRISAFNQGFPATVEEVVKAPLYAVSKLLQKDKELVNELAFEALKSVKMEGFQKRLIGKLSTGQQQRVFIAKALINNPKVIFMDEPTAGIDNKSEEEFLNLLYEFNKIKNLTLVLVTHDYTDIKSMISKVLCLSDGKVLEKCSDM